MIRPFRPEVCFPETLEVFDELVEFRHDLHQHPELAFETTRTCGKIVEKLRAWGVDEIDTTTVPGAVIAVVKGNRPGKTVALRGDIDALPMPDNSDNPWKSCEAGRCHACGHDGHTTWTLGALYVLTRRRDFPGQVVGIFQPAEESGGGAAAIANSGIFEKYGICEIYGGHDEGTRDKGVFGFRVGPAMASVDFFYITVTGQGTHGARPHLGHDPVPVAAEIISALQTLVSRRVDPIEKAVVSVCSVNAGNYNAPNVIPAVATMSGTVRTFNEDVRKLVSTELPRIAEGVAEACGCKAEVTYEKQTPAVINHPLTTKVLSDYVRKHFGDDAADENFPISMGGDDFAEYQFKVPGSIIRVGVRDEAHTFSIHNNRFDFNDEVLAMASTLFAGVALERLEALA